MKKLVSMLLALAMVLTLAGSAMAETKDYSGYTIRIYSNSNSTERVTLAASTRPRKRASPSPSTITPSSPATTPPSRRQTRSKDGDILFGLNETRWCSGRRRHLREPEAGGLDSVLGGRSRRVRLPRQGVRPRRAERPDALPQRRARAPTAKRSTSSTGLTSSTAAITWYRQDKVGGTTNSQHQLRHALRLHRSRPAPPAASPSMAGRRCGSTAPNGVLHRRLASTALTR